MSKPPIRPRRAFLQVKTTTNSFAQTIHSGYRLSLRTGGYMPRKRGAPCPVAQRSCEPIKRENFMGVATVAVVGCGMMGRGIMEVAAAAGLQVKGIKLTPGDLAGTKAKVQQALDRSVKKGKMPAEECAAVLGRIELSSGLAAVSTADVVIESAVEDEATKIKLLKDIEAKMHPEAVLGTNTSSLRLDTLAKSLARPERFL